MNFEGLYLLACEMCKEEPLYLIHYQDIDKCLEYLKSNNLVENFLDKGHLIPYENFKYGEYLSSQYILDGKEYILYFPVEIKLIKMMSENTNKKLNRWKLDCIEKVLLYGWKHFKEIYLRRIL